MWQHSSIIAREGLTSLAGATGADHELNAAGWGARAPMSQRRDDGGL
jgi:hypothetical protein